MKPGPLRSDESVAEVLLWQSRYRIGVAGAIGLFAIPLRAAGIVGSNTIVAQRWSAGVALLACAALIAAYGGAVAAIAQCIKSRPRLAPGAVAVTTAADLVLIFGATFLVSPPEHYDRALILGAFSLQLTLVDFGRRAARGVLIAVPAGYIGMLSAASAAGSTVNWGDALWTAGIFALGATVLVRVYGAFASRLGRMTALFTRAEQGDFSTEYDVGADARPDAITLVGRAYNRMRAQLSTIVHTDPLSGCMNRLGFDQQLAREASRAFRAKGDLAVLAIDVDHFKEINDKYGHLAGDEAIREIGDILRRTARVTDVVARTGGEEFMIVAPDTDATGAQRLASRICEAFRTTMFRSINGSRRVTVSVGVVSDRVVDESLAGSLCARADQALYAAKRSGRDRICSWTHLRPGALTPNLRLERVASA